MDASALVGQVLSLLREGALLLLLLVVSAAVAALRAWLKQSLLESAAQQAALAAEEEKASAAKGQPTTAGLSALRSAIEHLSDGFPRESYGALRQAILAQLARLGIGATVPPPGTPPPKDKP